MKKKGKRFTLGLGGRGYTLVEVAIILAIIGLMVSGAIVPLGSQIEEHSYEDSDLLMERIIDSITGYAVSNRTPGVLIRYSDHADSNQNSIRDSLGYYGYRTAHIPPGRPYLPCPSEANDGTEDRHPLVIGGQALQNHPFEYPEEKRYLFRAAATVSVSYAVRDPDIGANGGRLPLGYCVTDTGFLPWRTLGLPRGTDSFGNPIGYAVHSSFSTGAFGFDQSTRGMFVNTNAEMNAITVSDQRPTGLSGFILRRDRLSTPIFVCSIRILENPAPAFLPYCTGNKAFNISDHLPGLGPSYNNSAQLNSHLNHHMSPVLNNMQGIVNSSSDSLPFIVIMPNRRAANCGAVLEKGKVGSGAAELYLNPEIVNLEYNRACMQRSGTTHDLDDKYALGNAVRSAVTVGFDASNSSCLARLSLCPNRYYYAHKRTGSIWPWEDTNKARDVLVPVVKTSGGDDIKFDDSVGWLTRRELVQIMIDNNVLPVEPFRGLLTGQSYLY